MTAQEKVEYLRTELMVKYIHGSEFTKAEVDTAISDLRYIQNVEEQCAANSGITQVLTTLLRVHKFFLKSQDFEYFMDILFYIINCGMQQKLQLSDQYKGEISAEVISRIQQKFTSADLKIYFFYNARGVLRNQILGKDVKKVWFIDSVHYKCSICSSLIHRYSEGCKTHGLVAVEDVGSNYNIVEDEALLINEQYFLGLPQHHYIEQYQHHLNHCIKGEWIHAMHSCGADCKPMYFSYEEACLCLEKKRNYIVNKYQFGVF